MISFALSPKRKKNSIPQSEQNMNNIYNLACSACIAELKRQMIQVRYIITFALELCKWNWQAGK